MQPLIKALAWTFVHSLWQGLLAALLTAVIISITGKTKARLRYNSMGIIFMLFLTTVLITFIDQFQEATSSSLGSATAGNEGFITIADKSTEVITGGFIDDLDMWVNNNTRLLMLVWALFFLVNCMKLVAGLTAVNRLRHHKIHPVSEEWKIKLQQLQETLGIRRSITLLQSELIKVPVALGFLKPVILLPVGLLMSIPPEQTETILLHELGHIRRRDYLVNLFQYFAEAIFFFNPAILWISSLLRQEREACCDDIVIARIRQKRNYLNALVSFQEYTFAHNHYAIGISSRKQYLLCRVKRIITNENKRLNLLEKTALLSGLLLFSAFTYVSQEKESFGVPLIAAVEQFNNVQQGNELPVKTILTDPGTKPTGKQKKKINHSYKPVTDTVPGKKNKAAQVISDPPQKQTTEKVQDKTEPDAKTVLEEIKQIKEQIGKKKESIGSKKEQLNAGQGKNTKEEQALKDQIERERDEIESKREELERKRVLLENLKKNDEMKKEIKNRLKNEMKNENGEMKKEIKNQLKNEKKNEQKYELKNEMQNQDDKTILFQNRKTILFQNISETKPTIIAETRTDKFKVNHIKPEEKKYQLKKDIQLKTEPPKPPAAKENAKSPAPPKVKALTTPVKQR